MDRLEILGVVLMLAGALITLGALSSNHMKKKGQFDPAGRGDK